MQSAKVHAFRFPFFLPARLAGFGQSLFAPLDLSGREILRHPARHSSECLGCFIHFLNCRAAFPALFWPPKDWSARRAYAHTSGFLSSFRILLSYIRLCSTGRAKQFLTGRHATNRTGFVRNSDAFFALPTTSTHQISLYLPCKGCRRLYTFREGRALHPLPGIELVPSGGSFFQGGIHTINIAPVHHKTCDDVSLHKCWRHRFRFRPRRFKNTQFNHSISGMPTRSRFQSRHKLRAIMF